MRLKRVEVDGEAEYAGPEWGLPLDVRPAVVPPVGLEDRDDPLQPRNVLEDPAGQLGHPIDHPLLARCEGRAAVQLLGRLGGQRDRAEMDEQRRDLDLPRVLHADRGGQPRDVFAHARAPAERRRGGEREHIRERLDAALERLVEELLLRGPQSVLFDGGAACRQQLVRRTRLGEKAEHVTHVDGGDRRLDVGVPGEQDARRVRREQPRLAEKRIAGHPGHPHVGDDRGEPARVRSEVLKGVVRPDGRRHVVVPAQRVLE